jgi:cytochrome c oxidase subunit 2
VAKWWSILFAVVMLACGLSFIVAPFVGWWLPPGYSTHAWDVDFLFYIILWITAFFFFLTEGLMVWFLYAYAGRAPGQPAAAPRPAPAASHGFFNEHNIEIAWSIVPAIILLYIAFAQIPAWSNIKYESRAPRYDGTDVPLQVAVSARQFEWRLRYPSTKRCRLWLDKKEPKKDYESFAKVPQFDDLQTVNELHSWKGQPVMIMLSTRDVIHSFNIPVFRVKQDALPGREIPVWFTPTKANTVLKDGKWLHGYDTEAKKEDKTLAWDLPCAELCGWGHYRMIAKVYIHETREDFLSWLESVEKQQSIAQGQ